MTFKMKIVRQIWALYDAILTIFRVKKPVFWTLLKMLWSCLEVVWALFLALKAPFSSVFLLEGSYMTFETEI